MKKIFLLVFAVVLWPGIKAEIGTNITFKIVDPKDPWYHHREELLKWDPPYEIQKNFVYYHSGYDRDGRPIWVSEAGKYDFRSVIEKGGELKLALDKYIDQAIARLNQSVIDANKNRSRDHPVDGFVFILDLDEYSIQQFSSPPTVQYTLGIANKFDRGCFKTLKRGFLINANLIAESMYNLAKPLLGQTLNRMDIYGTNVARWKPIVIKHIPRDQIQKWYGGTAEPESIVKAYG